MTVQQAVDYLKYRCQLACDAVGARQPPAWSLQDITAVRTLVAHAEGREGPAT